MKTKIRQLITDAEKIKLTAGEKDSIRQNISAFSENYVAKPPVSTVSPFGIKSPFFNPMMYRMASAFALVLIIGSGTAFASQRALPGDTLYTLKTKVNEKVAGFFVIGLENKAAWNQEIANRRIDEAVTLASNGKLTSEAQTQIASEITSQTRAFSQTVTSFESKGKINTAAKLTGSLSNDFKARKNTLDNIVAHTPDEQAAIVALSAVLETNIQAGGNVTAAATLSTTATSTSVTASTTTSVKAKATSSSTLPSIH